MKEQRAAGGAERQITEFVEDHEVASYQPVRDLARSARSFLLLQRINQIDRAEEPNFLAMVFNRLNAKGCPYVSLSRVLAAAWTRG
jgi:hypothetical protein